MSDTITTTFESLGLSPKILSAIEKLGFTEPTPIQQEAIPLVLDGRDIMGLAQTGTGKTAAFGLPLVEHILKHKGRPNPKTAKALVLAPTRELANQIAENLRAYVKGTSIRVNVVVGGASINIQRRKLERGTDILIATPGRLIDLIDRKAIRLDETKFLVLDEADQMLDLGFIHSLRQIAKLLARPRQTLLFSATMPKEMAELSQSYLDDPIRIETAIIGKAADKIAQEVHFLDQGAKADLLEKCLGSSGGATSIVFARTKYGAEKLMKRISAKGFKAESIHGNKSQGQRDRAIKAFKERKVDVLVATDVAARGIDISGVTHVYNFDLPEVPENYVHRIGRTARAGAEGKAIAFCGSHEAHLLRGIEKLMDMEIETASGERPSKVSKKGGDNNQRRRGNNKNRRRGAKASSDAAKPNAAKRPATKRNAEGKKNRWRKTAKKNVG